MKPSREIDPGSPAGVTEIEGGFAKLVFERTMAHPPEVVWAAITQARHLRRWLMASTVYIEAKMGGSIEIVAGPPPQIRSTGSILAWQPPTLFEYEFNVDPRAEHPNGERSIVRWELSRAGSSTKLRLTHRRLTEPAAMGYGPGWHTFLDRLSAELDGLPLPDWNERFGELLHAYGVDISAH